MFDLIPRLPPRRTMGQVLSNLESDFGSSSSDLGHGTPRHGRPGGGCHVKGERNRKAFLHCPGGSHPGLVSGSEAMLDHRGEPVPSLQLPGAFQRSNRGTEHYVVE